MPFAPFIGVNNHFQSTIFGCALLSDETTSTFIWVMKTWLMAMDGKAPNAILTDQDRAMKAAIAEVFPNTRHRSYLWHIMRKVPEKIGHVIQKHEDFMKDFKRCIYRTWTEQCFETSWFQMVEKYELQNEKWLQSLFDDRMQWVPTFMRDMFFAGMSTTQRSESINPFFDKYVNKKTSLKEFVSKYKQAVEDRKRDEEKADAKCFHKAPTLKTSSPFEAQASKFYTHALFMQFQCEIFGASGCYPSRVAAHQHFVTFKVWDFKMQENFFVNWDSKNAYVNCLCHCFEYKGFLCRHCLVVLHNLGVLVIPSTYLLARWAKNVITNKKRRASDHVPSQEEKYKSICLLTTKINTEASYCDESYDLAYSMLEEVLQKCTSMNYIQREASRNQQKENLDILDPKKVNTKGAPSKRLKSGVELSQSKEAGKKKRKVLGLLETNSAVCTEYGNLINQTQLSQTYSVANFGFGKLNATVCANMDSNMAKSLLEITELSQVDTSGTQLDENW